MPLPLYGRLQEAPGACAAWRGPPPCRLALLLRKAGGGLEGVDQGESGSANAEPLRGAGQEVE